MGTTIWSRRCHRSTSPNASANTSANTNANTRNVQTLVCKQPEQLGEQMQVEQMCRMCSMLYKKAQGKWHIVSVMEPKIVVCITCSHHPSMNRTQLSKFILKLCSQTT